MGSEKRTKIKKENLNNSLGITIYELNRDENM